MLGHVMAERLKQALGIDARVGLAGHEPNHAALLAGTIDLYADYLGTAVRRYLGLEPPGGAEATYRIVRDGARQRWGVEWLPAFGFNNTYAVVVRRALADALGLRVITDLLSHASSLRLGGTADFLADDSQVRFAPGGYAGLRAAYGLTFGRTIELPSDYGATHAALGAGEVDAIVDFPVNPRMVSLDLVELADTRGFFAPYFAAAVVSGALLAAQPGARAALESLSGRIDNRRAAAMNHAVEIGGRGARDVASELLAEISADSTGVGPARRASRRPAG